MEPKILATKQQPIIIPLQVKPHTHEGIPTFTGSAISDQAGTVLYGYYSMDYKLPGNDCLRIFANHNKKHIQLMLLTHDPEKLKQLPGARSSSLVAHSINLINRYCIRGSHYQKPLTKAQETKYQLAKTCIEKLTELLPKERELSCTDWANQEALRVQVISILEDCRNDNLLLAINPIVSAGTLDTVLYEARQAAQHYQFNRLYPVCKIDQLDFSDENNASTFVWDSELHIGQNEESLNDAIRVICQQYNLPTSASLSNIPANRFKRLELFIRKLWLDGRSWINHLAYPQEIHHETHTDTRLDGLSITKIKPYYSLEGLAQIGYPSLEALVSGINKNPAFSHIETTSKQEALDWLAIHPNGSWVILSSQQVLLRLNDSIVPVNYYEDKNLFYPLPCGEDLYTLSQLGKRHLYLPERASLQLKAFFSRLPLFFKHLFERIRKFTVTLYQEFLKHIHQDHEELIVPDSIPEAQQTTHLNILHEALHSNGLLINGVTLEDFVKEQLQKNHYIIVREKHSPSPPPYENPLHRFLNVLRHLGGIFVDTSEKNPILGTLAMAAYVYGAGAVIAPETLTTLLMKLHMNGLISGIKPTQEFAKWLSHGTTSEAISAAVTYWQGVVVGGDLDKFFINAVGLLKEEPAEVAIIVSLAMSLGYGLCKTIPRLGEEMGRFPYVNYAALGAKGGAAFYDIVMHPGDDWLLGSIKWLLRGVLTFSKFAIGPLVEGYSYGYSKGFISGLKKSYHLFVNSTKQFSAAIADLILAIATVPLLELSSLLLHVPFRGFTKFISKSLAIIGNWQIIGGIFTEFANRPNSWGYLPGFRPSPLYGFSNPFRRYANNLFLNIALNITAFLFWLPFSLIKNIVILPIIDLTSFVLRFTITLLDPVSRVLAFGVGTLLTKAGIVWDRTLGRLFQLGAYATTLGSNKLDHIAGNLKQKMVAGIQVWRRNLYHWAFPQEEEQTMHNVNTDTEYCKQKWERIEKLPHTSTGCILDKLFKNLSFDSSSSPQAPQQHPILFHQKPDAPDVSLELAESTHLHSCL